MNYIEIKPDRVLIDQLENLLMEGVSLVECSSWSDNHPIQHWLIKARAHLRGEDT